MGAGLEDELAAGTDEISRLFDMAGDMLAVSRDGYFTRLNRAWSTTLGWSRDELMARPFLEFVHPDDLDRTLEITSWALNGTAEVAGFENRYRCADGTWRWLAWTAKFRDGAWYASARDVTDRKEETSRALHDPLTGLPTRLLLIDRLGHALSRLGRQDGMVALLFADLDRFKLINDGFGHEAGDRVLLAVADRLRSTLREVDTIARIGGDEFVVLVEDLAGQGEAVEVGERVSEALACDVSVADEQVQVHGSVGIATTSDPSCSADELLREADVAMYRAKAKGGGVAVFDGRMRREVGERMRAEAELRRTVDRDGLTVLYQPIVSLQDGSVSSCEALVRWPDDEGGLRGPDEFIPLAEETGLIVPLGEAVLSAACRQARDWRREGSNVGISVNVSPQQLTRGDFLRRVSETLAETGLPPQALCLELTETALAPGSARLASALGALKDVGVRIAIDDFGRGYSSLSYLKTLPLDVVKIDLSFVAGLETSRTDRAIVSSVLSLADEMELPVIAEGVETGAQHSLLRQMGCPLAQGFLYAPPLPSGDLSLDGFASHAAPGVGDPSVIREFMRQIGIPARIEP